MPDFAVRLYASAICFRLFRMQRDGQTLGHYLKTATKVWGAGTDFCVFGVSGMAWGARSRLPNPRPIFERNHRLIF